MSSKALLTPKAVSTYTFVDGGNTDGVQIDQLDFSHLDSAQKAALMTLNSNTTDFGFNPPILTGLTALQILSLRSNTNLTEPPVFAGLTSLATLDMQGCNLQSAPDFADAIALSDVNLTDNPLMGGAPDVSALVNMQVLRFKNIGMVTAPSVSHMPNLRTANFSNNTGVIAAPSFAGLLSLGGVYFIGCSLPQAEVDQILVDLVANGNTGGSAVNLSGGTNATPSATGLAAKATLEGWGWFVGVN